MTLLTSCEPSVFGTLPWDPNNNKKDIWVGFVGFCSVISSEGGFLNLVIEVAQLIARCPNLHYAASVERLLLKAVGDFGVPPYEL